MRGARAVHKHVLAANPDAGMRVFFVWSSILSSDDRAAAARLAQELSDPRATSLWDPDEDVGVALKPRLAIGDAPFAWDVYCFFGREARWTDTAPEVARWAHQLGGADPEHFFGLRLGETLCAWTRELLGAEARPRPPEPLPAKRIELRAEDIRPIPEVLLDEILRDLTDDVAAGKSDVSPAALERIGAELRRRMAKATAPFAGELPRAVRYEGQVLLVQGGDCGAPK